MWIEIGHFALAMALAVSLILAIVPMVGAWRSDVRLMGVARPAAIALFALNVLAFGLLLSAFVRHDFSVALVAQHSNLSLPLAMRVAATWGSHEGSLLLWSLMLSGWTAAVALFSRGLADVLRARILAVMGMVGVGFLLFLLLTSNPFERVVPAAIDGRDLNPLLQDPGMIFHPPLLYMGYVGLSVAFAFAVAGLIGGHFDAAWARWARPWTTVAWAFLTLGIALGSFWAYYELGWGGWWFWDPVENASFMPWLVATALIHSLAVTEKRGAFRSWTVLLAITGFSLSLLGTFLVRSGVLTSVHAFATDPARGVFILAFLAVVIGGSLTLFAARASAVSSQARFEGISRESMLLANNILLVVAMGVVLLGTLYPLLLDTLGMGKISVGPPYFDAVFVPVMAPALFLMGIGPLARWKSSPLPPLAVRLRWALVVSVLAGLAAPAVAVALGAPGAGWRPLASLGYSLAIWIVLTVGVGVVDTMRGADGRLVAGAIGRRMAMQPISVWGMHLAHLGIAAFVIGVTTVSSFEIENELALSPGESTELAGYRLRFDALSQVHGPNFDGLRGRFSLRAADVADSEPPRRVLLAEKRTYTSSGMPMTEAAIDRSLLRDVYLSMGEPLDGQRWVVRLHYKPLVNWIWLGCLMMALGGFVAIADRRYRRVTERSRAGGPALGADAGASTAR
ncbi:MAG: heme lyase CcmF/NrfE family subunit [Burkholderiaceae bacterium]